MPRRLLPALVLVAAAACSSSATHASTATTAARGAKTTTTTATTAAPATTLEARTASWSLPARLSREAVIVDHDQLVVAGGLTTGDQTVGTVYRIDPSTGAATTLPALPSRAHDVAGAFIAGRALVLGGGWQTESSDVQAVGTSPSVVGHLPAPRADLATVTTGAATYVVGGYDGHDALADVLRTTDGTHFDVVTQLPVPVRYAALAVLGSTLWVFGGDLGTVDTDTIQAIDLTTRTATVAGHLPATLGHASAFVLHGTAWVVGGRAGGAPSANIRRFDPTTRSVSVVGKLPIPVRDAAVAVVGTTAYLLGGQSPNPINDVVVLR